MEQPGSPAAFSALVLAVSIAAGLNIFCVSSLSTPTTNISGSTVTVTSGRTQTDGQIVTTSNHDFLNTSVTTIPTTLPIATEKRLPEQNTTIAPTVTVPEVEALTTVSHSRTLDTTTTVADASALPNTGQRATEDAPTSVMSVGTSTEGTTSRLETLERITSAVTQSPNVTDLNSTSGTWMTSKETSAASSVTSKHLHMTETTSGGTPVISTLPGSEKGVTSSQVTQASKVTSETSPTEGSTFSVGVTMQEIKHALSSGSIAAITIAVIALVLLVFSMAAFLKIRHSSYGRLLDDHEYGSWGNYNNPLYDDS